MVVDRHASGAGEAHPSPRCARSSLCLGERLLSPQADIAMSTSKYIPEVRPESSLGCLSERQRSSHRQIAALGVIRARGKLLAESRGIGSTQGYLP